MNTRRLSWVAIGLWVVTLIVAAVFFIRGQTAPSTDGRREIALAPAERDLVLAEMRTMLHSVHGIVTGVQQNDRQAVAKTARASGMAAAVDLSPQLMAKLPLEFKQLGVSVHKRFDQLAARAGAGASRDELLTTLSTQLSACVACHAGYRLAVAEMK